jgi:hypothetical protein
LKDLIAERRKRRSYAECKLFGGAGSTPMQSDDVTLHNLEEYFTSARIVHKHADPGLLFNQLVQELKVPWGLTQMKGAKYTPEGYSIFGGLVDHVTNAHTNNKSWNGKITAKMFYTCQGRFISSHGLLQRKHAVVMPAGMTSMLYFHSS